MRKSIEDIAACFAVAGEITAAGPFGRGHINDSHLLTFRHGSECRRFLLQRINADVFRQPQHLMANIDRVTAHIRQKLESQGVADVDRRVLTLVQTCDGGLWARDRRGSCWRMYVFIERTRIREVVETPEQAEQAGRAFGAFQHLLADLPGPRLHETIPDFHNTPARFEALVRAVEADAHNRARAARAEIDFALEHRPLASSLLDLQRDGTIPERVVHNDAKMSNVLLDEVSGEAICVTDLDTVMPGLVLYDFGDMMRTMTSRGAEDETNLAKVEVHMPLFEALARGYVESARPFLSDAERLHLVLAGKLITLEQGVRFLTDYLNGDRYYKTTRPGHNLARCRTQLALLKSIARHEDQMSQYIAGL